MKLLLLIFLLYINYSFSQITEDDPFKKNAHEYPKKYRTGLLQYNNAGKYVKLARQMGKVKKQNQYKDYTVFPKPFPNVGHHVHVNHQIVPDSPYFPVEQPEEAHISRSRVKKVLPQFIRHKRSTNDKDVNKKVKAPAKPKSKSDSGPKTPKVVVHKNSKIGSVGKKLRPAPKVRSKNEGQAKKPNAAKAAVSRTDKKKRGIGKRTVSRIENKKLKPSNTQNQKLKQKRSRVSAGRPQKLKTTDKKKISAVSRTEKNSKARKPIKKTGKSRSLSKKPLKKLSQAQRTRSSKNRTLRSKEPDARRLIAGSDAMIEDYPYSVSIQKDRAHWCSGAILNPRLIITTANCLWRSTSISRMHVRAGSRHSDHGGQVARIQEVMKHPGWKLRKNPDHDVALAVLDKNLRFSHGVHGVDLPNRVMMPPFDDVWVTSWGSERRDGIFEPRNMNLQVYQARLMERDQCNNVTQRFGVSVSENFICLTQKGRHAPCTRDTGAPAVSDGVLWGLASWGIRKLCGTERFPAMFSYVASQSNMDFIINATHYLMADERTYPFADRYPLRKMSITTSEPATLPY